MANTSLPRTRRNPMFELGLTSFAEAPPEPVGGKVTTHGERLRNVIEEIVTAD